MDPHRSGRRAGPLRAAGRVRWRSQALRPEPKTPTERPKLPPGALSAKPSTQFSVSGSVKGDRRFHSFRRARVKAKVVSSAMSVGIACCNCRLMVLPLCVGEWLREPTQHTNTTTTHRGRGLRLHPTQPQSKLTSLSDPSPSSINSASPLPFARTSVPITCPSISNPCPIPNLLSFSTVARAIPCISSHKAFPGRDSCSFWRLAWVKSLLAASTRVLAATPRSSCTSLRVCRLRISADASNARTISPRTVSGSSQASENAGDFCHFLIAFSSTPIARATADRLASGVSNRCAMAASWRLLNGRSDLGVTAGIIWAHFSLEPTPPGSIPRRFQSPIPAGRRAYVPCSWA